MNLGDRQLPVHVNRVLRLSPNTFGLRTSAEHQELVAELGDHHHLASN